MTGLRLGFVISELADERPVYTTITVALAALRRGHEVWLIEASEFVHDADDRIHVRARSTPERESGLAAGFEYLDSLLGPEARRERFALDELDVVWLRNEPSFDAEARPWASSAVYSFARVAELRGVVVLSPPDSLARAGADKLYTLGFPSAVRPKTIVTRDLGELAEFADSAPGDIVVKPLQGAGGRRVFFLRSGDRRNLPQIFETVSELGYVVAQEYVEATREGTIRLFMLEGEPLMTGGKFAATRHVPRPGDLRSNFRISGTIAHVEPDAETLAVAVEVGPRLVEDGLFLVGLDIAGGKLLESNIFSPGGLRGAEELQRRPFSEAVVEAMEDRVAQSRRSAQGLTA